MIMLPALANFQNKWKPSGAAPKLPLFLHFDNSKGIWQMARIIESATGHEALTFDDVLLQPGHSEIMPGQTNIATRIASDIELNLPILSSAMDTVTESRLAIAMAQAGGLGVIHRNLSPAAQAEEVRQVKKFESGMVVNPVTIGRRRSSLKRWR